jgi:hypothetical protein
MSHRSRGSAALHVSAAPFESPRSGQIQHGMKAVAADSLGVIRTDVLGTCVRPSNTVPCKNNTAVEKNSQDMYFDTTVSSLSKSSFFARSGPYPCVELE